MAAQAAPPPSLVVAKTMLTAALMRAEPNAVSRNDIQTFHSLLDAVLLTCSIANVQSCKDWLLKNTVISPRRVDAFGKYLARLAQSFIGPNDHSKPGTPSPTRKVVHILCLLHDLLHHVRAHTGDSVQLATALEPHLGIIFSVLFDRPPHKPALRQYIAKLTELFEDRELYSQSYRDRIHSALQHATGPKLGTSASRTDQAPLSDEVPYTLPSTHGDPDCPWFDLPAGVLMPHIRSNDARPIDPHKIKAVDLSHKSTEMDLIKAVKGLLRYSDRLFNDDDDAIVTDIDMMGRSLDHDELTGDLTVTEGYYGWSIGFCQAMKKRRQQELSARRSGRSPGGRSISAGSRSRSRSAGGSRNTSLERKRRRSTSQSRSRSWDSRGKRRQEKSLTYSRPATSPNGGPRRSLARAPYRSRSQSQEPKPNPRCSSPARRSDIATDQQPHLPPQHPPPNPFHPPSLYQSSAGSPGYANFPPPPRPPNYNGPWPPPPPPPPPLIRPSGSVNLQFPPFPPLPHNIATMYPMPVIPPVAPPPSYPPRQNWQQQRQQQQPLNPPHCQEWYQNQRQNNRYHRGSWGSS